MKYIQQYSYFFMLSIVLSCMTMIGLYIDSQATSEQREEQLENPMPSIVQQEQILLNQEIAYYKKEERKDGNRK